MIDRSILDHHIVGKSNDRIAMWLWMLSAAAWKERRIHPMGKEITLERGQFFASIRTISEQNRVSKGVVERFIRDLKNGTMIETVSETGGSVVTICNYEEYQSFENYSGTAKETPNEKVSGQQQDSGGTAAGHKRTKLNTLTKDIPQGQPDLLREENHLSQSEISQEQIIEAGWEDFKTIWPYGHPRREMGKEAHARYIKSVLGKNPKASERVTPDQLNAAARRYIEAEMKNQGGKYIKGTSSWLNQAKWEPYLQTQQLAKVISFDVSPGSPNYQPGSIAKRYAGLDTRPPEERKRQQRLV
jgi:hypothetical protein